MILLSKMVIKTPVFLGTPRVTPRTIIHRGYKKVNECYIPICGAEVKKAAQSNTEKCVLGAFLTRNYFPDEPTLKAGGLNGLPPDTAILEFFLQMMNDGKTLYCKIPESDEILGAAVCRTITPSTAQELKGFAARLRRLEAKRYIEFLAMLEERANLYQTFSANRMLQVEIVCTARKFRRRGIARQLLRGCLDMAKGYSSFDLLRFNTANIYGGRAAFKIPQYKVWSKKYVSSYKDSKGVPWLKNNLCLPHREIEVYTVNLKKLRAVKKDPCQN